MRIVVLDGYTLNPGDNPWKELAELGELTVYDRTPAELFLPRAREADVLLVNKVPLTAAALMQLPRLRFVSVLATGYNMIDIAAARQRGVAVANVPEYGTDSVAQHVFALLLELCQRVSIHHNLVTAGEWITAPDFCFWKVPPIELAGLVMGIVGLGRIGRRVGTIAHAFGMAVVAADPLASVEPEYQPFTRADIPAVFAAADVVSLHCPLTDDNAHFVDRKLLSCMKASAFLVNTARGQLVDEQALADALHTGRLAGAGLDVLAVEPMRADNPLLHAPNCIITPHLAWASLAARRRLMAATVANVEAFLSGHPINVVN
jgi:glycerate dehydrogenase